MGVRLIGGEVLFLEAAPLAAGDGVLGVSEAGDLTFDEAEREDVIGVEKFDEGAGGVFVGEVSRFRGGTAFVIDDAEAGVLESFEDFGGVVSGGVVDEDDLEFAVGLIEDGIERLFQIGTGIVAGNTDAYERRGHDAVVAEQSPMRRCSIR